MEESNEEHDIVPELYFLIAKFLTGGPLKETAKTLLKELESVEVLPRRLDWLGGEHAQSYRELESRYSDISWNRLVRVCGRALQLARISPSLSVAGDGPQSASSSLPASELGLRARLSLLSEWLVRPIPKYCSLEQDQSLVRRLVHRELGRSPAALPGGAGGPAVFPRRALCCLQLQRRTLGHLSAVYCLVFDPTGRYVITGADDLLVKVWSACDGRLVATLRGCGAEITDICVSADGALLACGSVERLVRVWCLATGAPRAVLHAHAGTITSVQWSPACRGSVRWLASTSTDGSVAFWTCSGDGQFLSQPVQYVERLRPGACHMICAAWSPGGALLACGSADQHVRLYAMPGTSGSGGGGGGPTRVLEIAVHADAVDSLAWAHRGLRFVSGSKDGSAALWTLHATQWRHTMLLPPELRRDHHKRLKVTMVAWDCSDTLIFTAVSDCTVRAWCSRSCRQLRVLSGHKDEAYVLEAHPFLPGVVLSAGHDGQLFVWDAPAGEALAHFHNRIEGQGDGAIFDAKWGGGASIAATDSHGHLLLLGLGRGHRLLAELPTELFFHTDYRPLVRDALGGALDEQTETPPHLMAPPFLVDVEGAPHAPQFQRLVPGRENLALSQLIPAAAAARSRIDSLIEALAAGVGPEDIGMEGAGGLGGGVRGVWRGEGVRHTLGSWQRGDPLLVPHSSRPLVQPLALAHQQRLEQAGAELNALEQSWYRREMRRRPLMISTAPDGGGGPRRRPAARAAPRARARVQAQVQRVVEDPPEADVEVESASERSDTSDSSVRLSGSARSSHTSRSSRSSRTSRSSSYDPTDCSSSHSGTKSDNSDSSKYSDWEAGTALAPPARARRRPLPARRYSPSTIAKRSERAGPSNADTDVTVGTGSTAEEPAATEELSELYRPGEWLTAVAPRKAPYHPQMGDVCLYFRLGHQRYFEAVAEKDLYKVNARDKPWERMHVQECELVKVVGIRYEIKPPRVACVRLSRDTGAGGGAGPSGEGGGAQERRGRSFTVRYHDMPDVIDFLVLHQQYETAVARRWGPGDRFRCMIDDSWWTGVVVERCSSVAEGGVEWAARAAEHFLSLRVRWDNGEVERLSPWDLEPLDPERLPATAGGAVPVLPHELERVLYRAARGEWGGGGAGARANACRAIAHHISQVMSLAVAEPFVAPVDLQAYPQYARVVPYPIDLATIKGRFDNLFYRRAAAAQFDVRYLATNAELFNEPHSPIVRQARLLTDLLLYIISHWREVDVVSKYHELAAAYHSSDEEPLAASRTKGSGRAGRAARDTRRTERVEAGAGVARAGAGGDATPRRRQWRQQCEGVLRELVSSADAQPFMQPVSLDQAPDYHLVVERGMDLGTVGARLADDGYTSPEQFAADVRLVFSNSRLYNTNKRSRIYSMTVRLAALFEALWSRVPPRARTRARAHARRTRNAPRTRTDAGLRERTRTHVRKGPKRSRTEVVRNGHTYSREPALSDTSDSETLAAASRRAHAARAGSAPGSAPAGADSWDSDAPLDAHRKGKGVGKKSKSSSNSLEPTASTSRARDHEPYAPDRVRAQERGARCTGAGSESSVYTNIEVVEEELLEDDIELTYDTGEHRSRRGKKRTRTSCSSSVGTGSLRRRATRNKDKHPVKRIRERFSLGSSSSSGSWSGSVSERSGGSGRRYESDRSYRPRRYSTDDDAPLHLYRQRQEQEQDGTQASTSGTRTSQHGHRHARSGRGDGGGVSLRARRTSCRYNEDSEEDSAAAITKRLQHHGTHHLAHRRRAHAAQSAELVGHAAAAHTNDHNYFNGNGAPAQQDPLAGVQGTSSSPAVSISSRGRVRKLTAKARGLLTE